MYVPRIPATAARTAARGPSPNGVREGEPPIDAVGAVEGGGARRALVGAAAPSSGETTVGRTLVAAALEGIVVASDIDFTSGTERSEATLLLKDGRARLALEGSPLELALPDDGAAPAGLWTRWRHAARGEGYEVLDVVTDAWTSLAGRLFAPHDGPSPVALSGAHERTRTSVLGTTTSTVTERLELALDGTFSRARSVFATTARAGLDGGAPSVLHVPETASHPDRLGGSWTLLEDGFTLELVDGDGRRERSLLLDGGGSRMIDGRRFSFTADRIETIDLFALATRWARGRAEASDWRSVVAEAMSRGVEDRASRSTGAARVDPARGRPEVPVRPFGA